jgi:hypothetical protein
MFLTMEVADRTKLSDLEKNVLIGKFYHVFINGYYHGSFYFPSSAAAWTKEWNDKFGGAVTRYVSTI